MWIICRDLKNDKPIYKIFHAIQGIVFAIKIGKDLTTLNYLAL
jgi:hypothetical protein